MKKLEYEICVGIGDNLVIRIYFDSIKYLYDEIKISHSKDIVNEYRDGDKGYFKFLDELGTLLFSEKPYVFDHEKRTPIQRISTILNLANKPRKPDINHLLCKGTPIGLDQEYVVITTKIRCLSAKSLNPLLGDLWNTLNKLSNKYKIVILGEKEVEESKEYIHSKDTIFSIYNKVMNNISNDRILDLTVPALGITTPDLNKLQQDCLIMSQAKAVITLGIGGNFWIAAATSNTICYREDDDKTIDLMSNPDYPTVFATKDWKQFIEKVENV